MNRFYCPDPKILDDFLFLDDKKTLHHIKRVLCLKPGEQVTVFDAKGAEYLCFIENIKDEVCLKIKDKVTLHKQISGIKLTVACAIPKNCRFDDIVDKLGQLGVYRIIPLVTERVIVKLDTKKERLKLERWRKIIKSSAQQSQRSVLPLLDDITSLEDLLKQVNCFDLKIIPTLAGERSLLREVIPAVKENISILVLIGPEGDFSDGEIEKCRKKGFIPVSLGRNVLRVDTAAIASAGFILFYANR